MRAPGVNRPQGGQGLRRPGPAGAGWAGRPGAVLVAMTAAALLATACQSPTGDTGAPQLPAAPGAVGAAGAASTVAVRAERHFAHCPLQQPADLPGLQVLDSAAQWDGVLALPEAQALAAPVDWVTARVLVVALGPVPTGGHRVAVRARDVPVVAGELRLGAQHLRPAADDTVSQAFTAPCLLLVLPRAGWQRAALRWQP